MVTRLVSLGIDANDHRARGWWAETLGTPVVEELDDEAWLAPAGAPEIIFLPVPEPKTFKNRIHLDLATYSEAEHHDLVAALLDRGATPVDLDPGVGDWIVLADPEGNEFCVVEPRPAHQYDGRIATIMFESTATAATGAFWAVASGWQELARGAAGAVFRQPSGAVRGSWSASSTTRSRRRTASTSMSRRSSATITTLRSRGCRRRRAPRRHRPGRRSVGRARRSGWERALRADTPLGPGRSAGNNLVVAKKRALDEYRAKRDFAATPEPSGDSTGDAPGARARFVVQEHHARALHWDLRLEHDGVLLSWAVPKGIPTLPERNHLAVHTEDHPLEYLDFEGEIPAGEYGGGRMGVWDRGEYEVHELRDDKLVVTFHGTRVRGKYALFQTKGKNWIIHRMDPPADPQRTLASAELRPMLATATPTLPIGDGWAFEIKWDGVRAIATVEGGRVRLTNRSGGDITRRYPEIRALGETLGSTEVVLDGEIVVFDGPRPSFELMQRRMHVEGEREIRRLASELPVVLVVFDLLWLDGHSTTTLPYTQRRRLLAALALAGPAWQSPPHEVGDGSATLAVANQYDLEGVVAKRLDSAYEPGRRSRAWLKWKRQLRQELVVGGWMPGTGGREGGIGSLLVGYHDAPGDATLRYAGRVGTGFTQAELTRLESRLGPAQRETNPFTAGRVPKGAVFVEPEMVVEVRFTEWTAAGSIRQPAYLGERSDKNPRDVVRELP